MTEKDLRDTKKKNSELQFERNKLSNERNEAVEQKELTIFSMNSLVWELEGLRKQSETGENDIKHLAEEKK